MVIIFLVRNATEGNWKTLKQVKLQMEKGRKKKRKFLRLKAILNTKHNVVRRISAKAINEFPHFPVVMSNQEPVPSQQKDGYSQETYSLFVRRTVRSGIPGLLYLDHVDVLHRMCACYLILLQAEEGLDILMKKTILHNNKFIEQTNN